MTYVPKELADKASDVLGDPREMVSTGRPMTLGRVVLDTARGKVKQRTLSEQEAQEIREGFSRRIEEMRGTDPATGKPE